MDIQQIGQRFQQGTCGVGGGFLLAGISLILSLALGIGLLRPLVGLISGKDSDKVRGSRVRRLTYAFVFTALSLAATVYFHAVLDAATRPEKLAFALSRLVLILFGTYSVLEILLTFISDFLPQLGGKAAVAPIFKDMFRTVIFLGIFVLAVKETFPKADIGAIMTTSAIFSVVIGLALQESLSNIFAGLTLSIDRPYKPGDWIDFDGKLGCVLDSNWRSTRILTMEDDIMFVPNSTLAKSKIVNFSAPTHAHLCKRRIGVSFGAQPNRVRQVLVNMMSHVDGVLKAPPPDVYVLEYADFSVAYEMRFWIEDFGRRPRIESEAMRGAWYHLKREGISIPLPARDIFIRPEKIDRSPEEILSLLKKVDILQPLKDPELRMLADDLTSQVFAKGETVCRQGDPGSAFFVIKGGVISVNVRGEGGVEAEVARLMPGGYFGEMSLLTGEPRTSTCKALEDSELLTLERESFSVLLQDNPPIAQAMSEILAARSTGTQERLAQERELMTRSRAKEDGSQSRRVLERIRGIFGFGGFGGFGGSKK